MNDKEYIMIRVAYLVVIALVVFIAVMNLIRL